VHFKPRLEALEDRTVPTITFDGPAPAFFGTSPPIGFEVFSPSAGTGFANWPEGVALVNSTINVTSDDGPFAVTLSAPQLPTGITETVDGTAVGSSPFTSPSSSSHTITFSGAPAQGTATSLPSLGKYSADFSATSSTVAKESVSLHMVLNVVPFVPPPIIFSPGNLLDDGSYDQLIQATVGQFFRVTVTAATATGTPTPISYSSLRTSTPTGNGVDVQFNGNTVTISGTPTANSSGSSKYFDEFYFSASGSGSFNTDHVLLAVQPASPVSSPTFYWQRTSASPIVDPTSRPGPGLQAINTYSSGGVTSSLVLSKSPDRAVFSYVDSNLTPSASASLTMDWSGAPPAIILPGQTFTILEHASGTFNNFPSLGQWGASVIARALTPTEQGSNLLDATYSGGQGISDAGTPEEVAASFTAPTDAVTRIGNTIFFANDHISIEESGSSASAGRGEFFSNTITFWSMERLPGCPRSPVPTTLLSR
jgi:hypothetical protein